MIENENQPVETLILEIMKVQETARVSQKSLHEQLEKMDSDAKHAHLMLDEMYSMVKL